MKLAKRLKKENVNVDVVNFGESETNTEKLKTFIETLNGGKDNAGSHLLTVAASLFLRTALNRSPIIQGEDGGEAVPAGGFEFGVDPNEDPELAMVKLPIPSFEQLRRISLKVKMVPSHYAGELIDSGLNICHRNFRRLECRWTRCVSKPKPRNRRLQRLRPGELRRLRRKVSRKL